MPRKRGGCTRRAELWRPVGPSSSIAPVTAGNPGKADTDKLNPVRGDVISSNI